MAVEGPLSGITVVDLSRILAGPYCTLLMAEMGARVIKVEPPKGGDDARAYGPFIKGRSTYFASVNRGKESIALDLKSPADKAIFEKLLAKADVLVENFRPGTMEKLGFGWETLHAKFPQLIYASASGFGHTGPNSKDPAYDMVMQGMGGVMSITGPESGPPVRVGMSIGDIGAGTLYRGGGQCRPRPSSQDRQIDQDRHRHVRCPDRAAQNAVMRYTVEGEIPGPLGARHPTITPFQAFRTKDGAMSSSPPATTACSSKMLRRVRPLRHGGKPRLQDQCAAQQHHGKLQHEIGAHVARRPTPRSIGSAVVGKAGVPCGPINNVEQALAHPQVAARNMLVIGSPTAAAARLSSPAIHSRCRPSTIRRRASRPPTSTEIATPSWRNSA